MTTEAVAASRLVVGVVGLGAMGIPMARQLLDAGARVRGLDLNPDALLRHRERGGAVAEGAADFADVDVVITSLPSTRALLAVLAELGPVVSSRSTPLPVIETSTLSLEDKFTALELAGSFQLLLVDCPLSGTSAQAEVGDLVAYCSGLQENVQDTVLATLETFTRASYDVGPFGNGTRMKLVANLLVAVHTAAAAEALLLAERSGLDPALVLEAVGDGAGSSRMLQVRGPLIERRRWEPATARISIFEKDITAIKALAADVAAPTPLLDTVGPLYSAASRQGRADHDAASVFEVIAALRPDLGTHGS